MKRKELQELAAIRLREAKLLLQGNCWEGAYYLGGYVAECALKACIARQTERHEFPDKKRADASHTHRLTDLLRVAGLEEALGEAVRHQPEFAANWQIVRDWSERSRYEKRSRSEAEALLKALQDRKYGVLPWLRKRW